VPDAIIDVIFDAFILQCHVVVVNTRKQITGASSTAIDNFSCSTFDMRCLRSLSIDSYCTLINFNPSIWESTSQSWRI